MPMDDFIRRAIMEDEIGKRDFDIWQADRQRQRQQQQEREQRQAAHARERRIVRQWLSRSDEVKTDFYSELDEGGSTGNDPAWNRWAEAIAHRIAAKLDIELNNDLIDQLEQYDAALQQRFDRRK